MASSRSAVGGLLRTSLLAAPRRHLVARRQLASNAARRSQADGDAEPRAPPPPRLISRPGPPPLKLRKDAAQPATAKTPANVRPEGEVAVGSSSGSSAPGARPQAPLPPLVVHDDAPSQLYDWRTFPSGVAPEDQPTLLLVRDAQLVESVLEYMGSCVSSLQARSASLQWADLRLVLLLASPDLSAWTVSRAEICLLCLACRSRADHPTPWRPQSSGRRSASIFNVAASPSSKRSQLTLSRPIACRCPDTSREQE